MMECYLAIPPKEYCDAHSILMPHEVNNQFLGKIVGASQDNKLPFNFRGISFSDHGTVIKTPEQIDDYLLKLQILEDNFDEIVKVIPLPQTIGSWDGHYYPGYLHHTFDGKEVDTVDFEAGDPGDPFTKEEFFKLLNLIRKKAMEAKEKNMNLVFSGD